MALRANQADQALIQYESGQELVAMEQLTAGSDNKTFSASDSPWSGVAGHEPDIRPDGLMTGGVISAGTGADEILVTAATAYQSGVAIEPAAVTQGGTPLDLDRDGQTDPYCIYSVVINDAGTPAFALVKGEEHASAFSSTRGADGGPPWIPTGQIEVGQIRVTSADAGVVASSEIFQVAGTHTERYDFPMYSEDYGAGEIEFISALPEIHSDDAGTTTATKEVYAEYYTPMFAPLEPASEFVPPETTHSQSSAQVYGGSIGSSSSSLNQGSFTAYLQDGVTDPLLSLKNQKLWFRFYPHRLRSPYILAQGILGISRTFPAGDSIQASCTLTADGPAMEFAE